MNTISKKQALLYGFFSLLAAFGILLCSNLLYWVLDTLRALTGFGGIAWLLEEYDRFDLLRCILMIVPGYFIYRHIKKGDPREKTLSWSLFRGLCFGIVAGIGFGGISFLWITFADVFLSGFGFVKQSLEALGGKAEGFSFLAGLLSVFVAGILGPISEELLFRGIILPLLERIKGGWFPVVVSALLFGLAHMNFTQSVYAFIMGLIAAAIYQKTRTLVWPIVMHITINVLASLSSFPQAQPFLEIWKAVSVVMILPLLGVLFQTLQAPKTIRFLGARE